MPKPFPSGSDPISRYRDGRKTYPDAIGILFQGDSWFAFPEPLRTNIVSELKNINNDSIIQLNLSQNGEEVREMLCGEAFAKLQQVMAWEELKFDCILFSGGGNDIVSTNLPSLLNKYRPGYTWDQCLNLPRFERRLQEGKNAYLDFADLRDDYQSDAWVFTHSYDFAIPTGQGVKLLWFNLAKGWLRDVMNAYMIPDDFQQEIVRYMLAQFDAMLAGLEATHEKWRHIRTQGTLLETDWEDELHPRTEGFKKIAAKFQEALRSVFPSLPKA